MIAHDGTNQKPAKLNWEAVDGAEYYVVNITGDDILDDLVIGTKKSVEFHYHTLVMKKLEGMPDVTVIRAEVAAINDEQVIRKMPYQELCKYIINYYYELNSVINHATLTVLFTFTLNLSLFSSISLLVAMNQICRLGACVILREFCEANKPLV